MSRQASAFFFEKKKQKTFVLKFILRQYILQK